MSSLNHPLGGGKRHRDETQLEQNGSLVNQTGIVDPPPPGARLGRKTLDLLLPSREVTGSASAWRFPKATLLCLAKLAFISPYINWLHKIQAQGHGLMSLSYRLQEGVLS